MKATVKIVETNELNEYITLPMRRRATGGAAYAW